MLLTIADFVAIDFTSGQKFLRCSIQEELDIKK